MKRSRRKFRAEFKARVVLEAIKEHKSLSELAEQFELHPNLISIWEREFLENAASVFSKGNEDKKAIQNAEKEKEELFKQIGQLKGENDWLKKKYYDSFGSNVSCLTSADALFIIHNVS